MSRLLAPWIVGGACCLAAAPPAAVAPSPAAATPPGEVSAAAIRAHMEFLADDLLEGRGTATRGHEIAARYVAAQFTAAGLEPGADGR